MVIIQRPPLISRAQNSEQGQAAVEFCLCLLFIIGFVALLFQAMQFERDVFNKSALLRYLMLHEARQNQPDTDPQNISDKTVQGKDLGQLTFFTVPLQDADLSQHWGPKKLVIRHGTHFWFPLPMSEGSEEAIFFGAMLADHDEDSSGNIGSIFGALGNIANNIPN